MRKPSFAICAIARDEDAFLVEWALHHLSIGFDKIYLYDNGSEHSLAACVDRFGLSEAVTTRFWPDRPGQLSAYTDFIDGESHNHDWVAFIDLDEFLIPKGTNQIGPIFTRFEAFSAVTVNWLTFGPSGHVFRPSGLVLRNYQRRLPRSHAINGHVKSIVKSSDLISRSNSPHIFVTSGDQCSASGTRIAPAPMQDIHEFPHLVLHHYITRSREDWDAKLRRGRGTTINPLNAYRESMFTDIQDEAVVSDKSALFFADRIEPDWRGRYSKGRL